MECPECNSTHIRKNGIKKGKKNHICVDCGRQFIDVYTPPRGYSDAMKRECLKMYVNGMGFRGIERVKGVHHTTLITWVRPEVLNLDGKTLQKALSRGGLLRMEAISRSLQAES